MALGIYKTKCHTGTQHSYITNFKQCSTGRAQHSVLTQHAHGYIHNQGHWYLPLTINPDPVKTEMHETETEEIHLSLWITNDPDLFLYSFLGSVSLTLRGKRPTNSF